MKTDVPKTTSRRPGKPSPADIREDIRNISALLSAGFSLQEIKSHLKLTERQLKWRMTAMRKMSRDYTDVWAKFQARSDTRYRHLEAIRASAMTDGKLDVARRAIENMARIDKQVVEVGQTLGEYKTAAKEIKHEHKVPTLGMFHRLGADEAEILEDGTVEVSKISAPHREIAPPREGSE